MRADLLALTADDLTSFSNRGLTRRAEQEAGSTGLTCEIAETTEGTVTVRWSDGVECSFPGGARLTDSRCSCPSTTLCRHVLRSVFAYQRQQAGAAVAPAPNVQTGKPSAPIPTPPLVQSASPPGASWNPAVITDAELAAFFSAAEFARWQREFSSGHVIQVWTGVKPRALLHTLGCTVNFLVPGDARYAVCDCAADAPCGHAALAVWAFRKLSSEQPNGLISTAPNPASPPAQLLDDIETELLRLAETGLARASNLQVDRWRRLADQAREHALVWPGEVLQDIAELHAAYLAHDARFDPREFLALVAELLQRMDAIRRERTPVPSLFVRGTAHDRETEFGSARLIGLGCTARGTRAGAELAAHLQDSDSGATISVTRYFPNPPPDGNKPAAPRPFAELARAIALKGVSLAALGRGQLLVKGGRRTPSGRFIPGRAPASVSPQAYAWETLRAPLRTSGVAELQEQLRDAPPAALAPRQKGARLTVCPVTSASEVQFDEARQEVIARIIDPLGATAWLVHPYLSRNAAGSERLLHALRNAPESVRFICAQARLSGADVVLAPLSVVFEESSRRTCVQPWVDEAQEARSTIGRAIEAPQSGGMVDPIHDYLDELLDLLTESWLTGPRSTTETWPRIAALGTSLGFSRLASFDRIDTPARLLELTVVTDFAHREFTRLAR